MGMKEKIIKQRGSMAVYVSVVLLSFLIIISVIYSSAIASRKAQLKTTMKVKESYETNYKRAEDIYQSQLDKIKPKEEIVVNKDTVSSTEHEKIIGKDKIGNQVVIPNGFKISEDSGETVKEGIVIEDNDGNQFVWVPVSNINGDGSNKIKVNSKDEEGIEITLGRYTFARTSPRNTDINTKGVRV